MHKIKMLSHQLASDVDQDGVNTGPKKFLAGEEYEVGDALARAFCDELKCATRVGGESPATPNPDAKPDKFEGAPENKESRGARRSRR
jgi:hypothetical protein